MKTINYHLLEETISYVKQLLEEKLPENYSFHNAEHARYVAEKALLIGKKSGLNEKELILVQICAWFHDTGYINGYENHEAESARLAMDFLDARKVEPQTVMQVKDCILATRIPQQPDNKMAEVLCDADMAHLAEDNYFERVEKMRVEWNKTRQIKLSKRKFHKVSEKFFRHHNFFTEFAREELGPKKEKNLRQIEKEIYLLELKREKKQTNKRKVKSKGYSRGVESMFRNTARMQINLSSIADNKSNILISVNAIIISIIVTLLVSRFEETPNIIIPTLIFLSFSLVTIVFAILSTRPHISSGIFSKSDVKKNKVNLLFFGNFYNMELEEYEAALDELMKNEDRLYANMILDQYSLGKVLAKKYKLLRVAYNVFMAGIIISVLAFLFAFLNI